MSETLQQAAERLYKFEQDPQLPNDNEHKEFVRIFIKGAKWQQERSYSEEEVWKLVNKLNQTLNIGSDLTLEEWFEQFKKK